MPENAPLSEFQAPRAEVICFVVEAQCPDCKGKGIITDPARDEFNLWWDEYRSRTGTIPTLGEMKAFAAEQGLDAPPPQFAPCTVCGGRGSLQKSIPIAEAARLLNDVERKRLQERVDEFRRQLEDYRRNQAKETAYKPEQCEAQQ